MLSILIPCYNYNVYTLVECLHREATTLSINFEILVQDDHSTNLFNNQLINQLIHCCFKSNTSNVGRAKNRNILLQQAQYNWVLFLDADVLPTSPNFIANYLQHLPHIPVVQGGLVYCNNSKNKHLLRWIYGSKREVFNSIDRQNNPYSHTLCSNLLIDRSKVSHFFCEGISLYGYEDLLFYKEIREKDYIALAINNPVEHLGLEDNVSFMQKTEEACQNLAMLIANNTLQYTDTKLSLYYNKLTSLKMTWILTLANRLTRSAIEKNLKGNSPTLLLFDIYKLLTYHRATISIRKS